MDPPGAKIPLSLLGTRGFGLASRVEEYAAKKKGDTSAVSFQNKAWTSALCIGAVFLQAEEACMSRVVSAQASSSSGSKIGMEPW